MVKTFVKVLKGHVDWTLLARKPLRGPARKESGLESGHADVGEDGVWITLSLCIA